MMVLRRPMQSDVLPAAKDPGNAQAFKMPARSCTCRSLIRSSSFMNKSAPAITPVTEEQHCLLADFGWLMQKSQANHSTLAIWIGYSTGHVKEK